MRKIYIGILLICYWLQKKNWRRPSGLVWRITTRIGAWSARIITGNSQVMLEESIKIIQQYGLQYYTGYPNYVGRIMVVTYDDVY